MRVTLDRAGAQELTDRIRASARLTAELLVEAYTGRAWAALGYSSWTAYVRAELNADQIKLPRIQREMLARAMAEAGASAREIAPTLGVGHATISRDLAPAVSNETPARADPPSEAEVAAQCADIIEQRYAEDPDSWRVPYELAPYIRVCWPWPTHNQHTSLRDVAYPLFLYCPPESPAWDLMDVWLYHVARPALEEYADLEREHPGYDWPGRKLAELCRVVCNPDLSVETRLMLRRQLEGPLAFAVLDCERFPTLDVQKWRSIAGLSSRLPERRDRGVQR